MLNFAGYDVSEPRRLFNGEIPVSAAGQTSMHRSPGYVQGFADPCYDPAASHACQPSSYGPSLTGYPGSVPTYGSYRLPFSMSHAAAVYDEQRKFECYSKQDLNCSTGISAHGNYIYICNTGRYKPRIGRTGRAWVLLPYITSNCVVCRHTPSHRRDRLTSINPFNASCSKLLLSKGFSVILV